jgi:hypothetical protein
VLNQKLEKLMLVIALSRGCRVTVAAPMTLCLPYRAASTSNAQTARLIGDEVPPSWRSSKGCLLLQRMSPELALSWLNLPCPPSVRCREQKQTR